MNVNWRRFSARRTNKVLLTGLRGKDDSLYEIANRLCGRQCPDLQHKFTLDECWRVQRLEPIVHRACVSSRSNFNVPSGHVRYRVAGASRHRPSHSHTDQGVARRVEV